MSDRWNGIEHPDDLPMFPEEEYVEPSRDPWTCMNCGLGFDYPDLNDVGPCCPRCDSIDIDERQPRDLQAEYAESDRLWEERLRVTGEQFVAETKVTESSLPIPNFRVRQAS